MMRMKLRFYLVLLASVLYSDNSLAGKQVVIIPLYSNPEYSEYCDIGTHAGENAFQLNQTSTTLAVGDIYTTAGTNKLIEIVGRLKGSSVYYKGEYFRFAPSNLPAPGVGTKGPYYFLTNGGNIVWADYL